MTITEVRNLATTAKQCGLTEIVIEDNYEFAKEFYEMVDREVEINEIVCHNDHRLASSWVKMFDFNFIFNNQL